MSNKWDKYVVTEDKWSKYEVKDKVNPIMQFISDLQSDIDKEGQVRSDLLSGKNVPKNMPQGVLKDNPFATLYNLGQSEISNMREGLSKLPNAIFAYYKKSYPERLMQQANIAQNVPQLLRDLLVSLGTSIEHPISSFGKPIEHITNLTTAYAGASKGMKTTKAIMPEKAKSFIGDTVADSASFATGIDPELTKRWVTNTKDVFTKDNLNKNAYALTGKQIQESIKEVGSEYAKATAKETATLKQIKQPMVFLDKDDLTKIGDIAQKRMYQIDGIVQGIDPNDMSVIGKYESMLTRPLDPLTGHKIKLEIDDILKNGFYDNASKTVKPLSTVLEKSLYEMRSAINSKLGILSTPYAEANANTSRLLNAEKALKGPLNSINPGKQLKSILSNDPEKTIALKDVSDALPPDKQFWEKVLNVQAAQESKRVFRKGGGMLSSIGAGSLAWVASTNPYIGGAIASLTSPYLVSRGLRTGAGLGNLGIAGARLPLKNMLATQLALQSGKLQNNNAQ